MIGYTDISHNNGHRVTCPVVCHRYGSPVARPIFGIPLKQSKMLVELVTVCPLLPLNIELRISKIYPINPEIRVIFVFPTWDTVPTPMASHDGIWTSGRTADPLHNHFKTFRDKVFGLGLADSSAELILGLCPANERRRYKVTPSLTGWAQTKNQLCFWDACT